MGSTRLPGKVLLPLHGRPLLERMLTRVQQAASLDEVVVATTRMAIDASIVNLAEALGVRCVIGHPDDLIDRHLQAARETGADAVVKIPSDCPLIDPAVIDQTVGFFRAQHPRYAFVSNLHPATWPDGNDVEVMRRDALETAWREAKRPYEREHTTPFIWDQPERFPIGNVVWSGGRDLSASHRIVLDYAEDYAVISALYEALAQVDDKPAFGVDAIVDYLDTHPELKAVNAMHAGKSWLQAHVRDLRTYARQTPFDGGVAVPDGAAVAGS